MNTRKKKTIHFRADGNKQIGLGHLIRCQSLAEMVKNNYEVRFSCRFIPRQLEQSFKYSGFSVNRIVNEREFLDSLSPDNGVVLDGYMFKSDYHQKITESGSKLALMDDLHDQPLCADLIINPAPGVLVEHYKVQLGCPLKPVFALGPQYALLRPAFLNTEPSQTKSSTRKNLFICFGGSDVKNLTEKVLEIAIDFKEFEKITIITGSAYHRHRELKQKFSIYGHVHFYHAVDDAVMAVKLAEADIAVVPSSGMLVEALYMQTVVISGMYVENQKNIYKGFKNLNAFIDAGKFETGNLKTAFVKAGYFKPDTTIDRASPDRYRALFEKVMN